MTKKQLNTIG